LWWGNSLKFHSLATTISRPTLERDSTLLGTSYTWKIFIWRSNSISRAHFNKGLHVDILRSPVTNINLANYVGQNILTNFPTCNHINLVKFNPHFLKFDHIFTNPYLSTFANICLHFSISVQICPQSPKISPHLQHA
jgi:hypothetical protein